MGSSPSNSIRPHKSPSTMQRQACAKAKTAAAFPFLVCILQKVQHKSADDAIFLLMLQNVHHSSGKMGNLSETGYLCCTFCNIVANFIKKSNFILHELQHNQPLQKAAAIRLPPYRPRVFNVTVSQILKIRHALSIADVRQVPSPSRGCRTECAPSLTPL